MTEEEVKILFNPEISTWREGHNKVDSDLDKSIGEEGLVTSMTARRLPNGKLEMIGGHERYKSLKKRGIPITKDMVHIKENVSDVDAVTMAIAENAVRKSLNAIEEARAFRTLKHYGLKIPAIAKKVGKSETTVRARLAALKLPKHIQQKMIDGAIEFGYAVVLLKLKGHKEAQTDLANKIANSRGYYSDVKSVKEANEIVSKFFEAVKRKEALVLKYGPCPKCGGKEISESNWSGEDDKLVCENEECKHTWHKVTKDPWKYYELQRTAKELGLELELQADGKTKLTPIEIQKILDRKTVEVVEEEKITPTFRSKANITDVAAALISGDNVMSLNVHGNNGDHLEIRLIEPSGLNFEAFKKDYKRTDDVTKVTANGWSGDGGLKEMKPKVEKFLKSLVA